VVSTELHAAKVARARYLSVSFHESGGLEISCRV